jgi:hypothetical protein
MKRKTPDDARGSPRAKCPNREDLATVGSMTSPDLVFFGPHGRLLGLLANAASLMWSTFDHDREPPNPTRALLPLERVVREASALSRDPSRKRLYLTMTCADVAWESRRGGSAKPRLADLRWTLDAIWETEGRVTDVLNSSAPALVCSPHDLRGRRFAGWPATAPFGAGLSPCCERFPPWTCWSKKTYLATNGSMYDLMIGEFYDDEMIPCLWHLDEREREPKCSERLGAGERSETVLEAPDVVSFVVHFVFDVLSQDRLGSLAAPQRENDAYEGLDWKPAMYSYLNAGGWRLPDHEILSADGWETCDGAPGGAYPASPVLSPEYWALRTSLTYGLCSLACSDDLKPSLHRAIDDVVAGRSGGEASPTTWGSMARLVSALLAENCPLPESECDVGLLRRLFEPVYGDRREARSPPARAVLRVGYGSLAGNGSDRDPSVPLTLSTYHK